MSRKKDQELTYVYELAEKFSLCMLQSDAGDINSALKALEYKRKLQEHFAKKSVAESRKIVSLFQ